MDTTAIIKSVMADKNITKNYIRERSSRQGVRGFSRIACSKPDCDGTWNTHQAHAVIDLKRQKVVRVRYLEFSRMERVKEVCLNHIEGGFRRHNLFCPLLESMSHTSRKMCPLSLLDLSTQKHLNSMSTFPSYFLLGSFLSLSLFASSLRSILNHKTHNTTITTQFHGIQSNIH